MSRDSTNEVRERATGAILRRAVLSWQTAVTLIITLVLYFGVQITNIPGWQQWFWLVLGAIAEAAFIISNMRDPEAASQAIASAFESRYDLRAIRSSVARQRLQSALEYRRNMLNLSSGTRARCVSAFSRQ